MEGIGSPRQSIERETDPVLEDLWRKYEFPGTPPFKGSVSEDRLKNSCKEYLNIVNNLQSPNLYAGDSENYVPPNRAVARAASSDSKRREIHNQITLMVVSKQRSGMDKVLAEHIAEFALEYAESSL